MKRLFLKTRAGKMFGSMYVSVSAISGAAAESGGPDYSPPGEFQIRYVLNPTGSRSLEPDPKRAYKSYRQYLKAEQKK